MKTYCNVLHMPSLIRIFANMTLSNLNFDFYKHVLTQKNFEKYIIKHVLAEHSLNRHEYVINLCFNRTCIMYCQKVCDGRTCFKKASGVMKDINFCFSEIPLLFTVSSVLPISGMPLMLQLTAILYFQNRLCC